MTPAPSLSGRCIMKGCAVSTTAPIHSLAPQRRATRYHMYFNTSHEKLGRSSRAQAADNHRNSAESDPRSRVSWSMADSDGIRSAVVMLGAAALLLGASDASLASEAPHQHPALNMVVGSLADNDAFWPNVLRYISFFFSVLLGTAYVAIQPIIKLLKKPSTAVFTVAALAFALFLLKGTVSAMLGVGTAQDLPPL
ncbi:hypothetical protein ACKKBF_B13565 [Auxenochlorella protothecoides x Auxenochlorella symbiontica]